LEKSKSSISVTFTDEGQVIAAGRSESILEVANRIQLDISQSCGGNASCGTCLIYVEKGLENCDPRNELEQEMAQDRGFRPHERLACQTTCFGTVTVRLAFRS